MFSVWSRCCGNKTSLDTTTTSEFVLTPRPQEQTNRNGSEQKSDGVLELTPPKMKNSRRIRADVKEDVHIGRPVEHERTALTESLKFIDASDRTEKMEETERKIDNGCSDLEDVGEQNKRVPLSVQIGLFLPAGMQAVQLRKREQLIELLRKRREQDECKK